MSLIIVLLALSQINEALFWGRMSSALQLINGTEIMRSDTLGKWGNAFSNASYQSDVVEAKFLMKGGQFSVGVIPTANIDFCLGVAAISGCSSANTIGWFASTGYIEDHPYSIHKYAGKYTRGDIITIILDFNQLKVFFLKNDINPEPEGFPIVPETSYSFGVSVNYGYSIQYISSSVNPTKTPYTTTKTSSATSNTVYNMSYLDKSSCNNLDESIEIDYKGTLSECMDSCEQNTPDCIMINYYFHLKTANDSRCYMFDKLCNIKVDDNNNKSVIGYRRFTTKCNDYPNDWIDSIGDSCYHYTTYNWCNNGNALKTGDEFTDLMDNKYETTAMNTCCGCGGGVHIMNNVAFSVDFEWIDFENDILCEWIHNNSNQHSETQSGVRDWNNIILYDICNYLEDINCDFLIDTQFKPVNFSYSLYLCEHNGTDPSIDFRFILELLIDDTLLEYAIFVNTLWFKLDLSYYSSNINMIYLNYSQCVAHIISDNNTTDTHRYGTHPCYVLDTLSPTSNQNGDERPDKWIVVLTISIILIMITMTCICVRVIYSIYISKKKANINEVEKQKESIEMKTHSATSVINGVYPASAPPLENNNVCIICCESKVNMFNDPCGHVTYCNNCVLLLNDDNKCPSCRQIVQFKQLYHAGFSQ